jgi:hypothetical protein
MPPDVYQHLVAGRGWSPAGYPDRPLSDQLLDRPG